MPDATRQVNRDARRLARLGYPRARALAVILTAARTARTRARADNTRATPWLDDIEQVAQARLGGNVPGNQSESRG